MKKGVPRPLGVDVLLRPSADKSAPNDPSIFPTIFANATGFPITLADLFVAVISSKVKFEVGGARGGVR